MDILIALCTCPDDASAARLAHALVEERLAACVNRIAGVRSTYAWQGAVHDDAEVLLLIKTEASRFDALRERVLALHPYELPELIAVEVTRGLDRYLAWVAAAVAAPADASLLKS